MSHHGGAPRRLTEMFQKGYKFVPTDQELAAHYLSKKENGEPIGAMEEYLSEVDESDIYGVAGSWGDKVEECGVLSEGGDKAWFFFVKRNERHSISVGSTRPVGGNNNKGFWKVISSDAPIRDSNGVAIAFKTTLLYFNGELAKGKKTRWIMEEFRSLTASSSADNSLKKYILGVIKYTRLRSTG